ncbi:MULTISPECIES: hypothetical protein [unclassified Enterobacter]|uniref:hypothetical protein n=1 Tax=unclassified Enterobacter TaxID=2608935 RepID=UPI0015C7FD6A|nr:MULTISPECIES: hypothetical protein [unclassified Enterobacter]MBB3305401.1 hypothetical protein [Enterobacter sp. Sphag1F]NYI14217.1 hypothetical protein [Enterobacter sp. Sphag71]
MNQPPVYADYATIYPARWRRWWVALPVLLFISAMITMLLWPEGKPTRSPLFWFWTLVLPLLCWLLAVTLRWLVWLQSSDNSRTHYAETSLALDAWWRQRSQALPVEAVLLVTPVGDDASEHLALLSQPADAPQPGINAAGYAELRCPLVLNSTRNRPEMLAAYLANRLVAHVRQSGETRPITHLCWLGDDQSLLAFRETLLAAGMKLPEEAIRLSAIDGKDSVIDLLANTAPTLLLCAGSGEGLSDGTQVAGEAAFAWLCSAQGTALMHRSECWQPALGETAALAVAQLSRYAGLSETPDTVIAADVPAMEALLDGGWSALDHVLAPWLGHAGQITPFTLRSLALLSALNGQSCGWIAAEMESQYITGVCIPRGNLPH